MDSSELSAFFLDQLAFSIANGAALNLYHHNIFMKVTYAPIISAQSDGMTSYGP